MNDKFDSYIKEISQEFKIDICLIKAIIKTESDFNMWAIRFEPNWNYFYKVAEFSEANKITLATEKTLQACSFGLMQIMGSVLREHGYKEPLLKSVTPNINIYYGCKHLKRFICKYSKVEDAISSYNAGYPKKDINGNYLNQAYVDRVIASMNLF